MIIFWKNSNFVVEQLGRRPSPVAGILCLPIFNYTPRTKNILQKNTGLVVLLRRARGVDRRIKGACRFLR